MDQTSSSNQSLSQEDQIGLLAAHVKLLSFTVDGLVRIMMSKGQLSERELEAINADAMRQAFGWELGKEDEDALAGSGGDIPRTTE